MEFASSRFDFIRSTYSRRVQRFFLHLAFSRSIWLHNSTKWYFWPIDLFIYLLDIMLIPDLIDVLWNSHKQKRKLNDGEIQMARAIFKNDLILDHIFVIENCHPLKKNLFHAFVSFNTIHCVQQIRATIMVHELVHVWQYQRFGTVYIIRALLAQHSINGYDYCGVVGLMDNLKSEKGLLNFNFEQQAEIIEDYYKLSQNKYEAISNRKIYEYYVEQLQYNKKSNIKMA